MVSLRRVALSDQAGLALFHLPQLWLLLLEQLRQFGFFAPTGCQGFPDLQESAAVGFGFILILATSKTQAPAALRQASARHRTAFLEELSVQGYGPRSPELLPGGGEISKHQRVAKHVSKHLVVNGLKPHEFDGTAD
jgi:hypothetical protein